MIDPDELLAPYANRKPPLKRSKWTEGETFIVWIATTGQLLFSSQHWQIHNAALYQKMKKWLRGPVKFSVKDLTTLWQLYVKSFPSSPAEVDFDDLFVKAELLPKFGKIKEDDPVFEEYLIQRGREKKFVMTESLYYMARQIQNPE